MESGLSDVELVADELLSFTPSRLKGHRVTPSCCISLEQGWTWTRRAGELVAYPNPFVNEIAIHWHGESAVKSLSVQDANGRLVSTSTATVDEWTLPLGRKSLGARRLLIHAVTDDGQFAVRLVK